MAQPEIAALYAEYVPDGLEIQNSIKDLMKERNPSLALEVHTPVGRADCVSIDTITEVAAIECWKAALGQVCAYRLHILRSHARIYLYGFDAAPRSLPWAVATCKHYDVCVSYELWERKRASRFQ